MSFGRVSAVACVLLGGVGCGYSPSADEVAAQEVLVGTLRARLQDLPKPADAIFAKVPGLSSDDRSYWGNYQGRYAFLDARYFSNVEPEAACAEYLAYVESKQWRLTQPTSQACKPSSRLHSRESSFGAWEEFPPGENAAFEIDVVARRWTSPYVQEGRQWLSEIEIHMKYVLDREAQARCVPPPGQAQQRWPCAQADWR